LSRFQNILVYAEASDSECLEQVVALAERHGAAVSVCDVIEPAPQFDPEGIVSRLQALDWKLAFERLRSLCAPFQRRIDIDYTVLTGNPFITVTEQVIQQRFDLVVHISRTISEAAGARLNPTGMHLVRKCPSAVWALHPQRAASRAGVVLAVDRDTVDASGATDAFALQLAASASTLASARGATLHLVHAWTPYASALLHHPQARLSPTAVDQYRQAQREDYRTWFDGLCSRIDEACPDTPVERHLLEGPAVHKVPELARTLNAELLVLGTIGTSTVPGVLIGTTAEAILSAASTPVLAIKPHGFTTPIRVSEATAANPAGSSHSSG